MRFGIIFFTLFFVLAIVSTAYIVDQKQPDTLVFCTNKEGINIICSDLLDVCNNFYNNKCKEIDIYSLIMVADNPNDPAENDSADNPSGNNSQFYDSVIDKDSLQSDRPIYVSVAQEGENVEITAENIFGVLPGSVIKVFKGNDLVKTVDSPEASFVLSEGLYDVRVERQGYVPTRQEFVVSKKSKNFKTATPIVQTVQFTDKKTPIKTAVDKAHFTDKNSKNLITGQVVASEDVIEKDLDFISMLIYSLMVVSFVSLIFIFVSKLKTN